MATYDATFISKPDGGDNPSTLDNEQRNLRVAIEERMANEHDTYVADGTAGAQVKDWVHKEGSAVAYYESAAPVNQPNAETLAARDAGRLWVDSDDDEIRHWDGSAWQTIKKISGILTIGGPLITTTAILHVQDQKASNTAGGTFTSGAWRTRVLNTEIENTITGASLATNQITLPAGTYRVRSRAPGYKVSVHRTRLQNITGGTTIGYGSSCSANASDATQTDSVLWITFTVAIETIIELQHRCSSTTATLGFGTQFGFEGVEIYSEVIVERIA